MSLRSRPFLIILIIVLALVAIGVVVYSKLKPNGPKPGEVLDEAREAQRPASSFSAADEDYFHDMDGGVQLTPEEIKGRNTWIVWTAGNDRFWDRMVNASAGALDFLKILSSHPSTPSRPRDKRWEYLGLVNDPCFEKATGPDPKRFNLWLDKRRADCPPEPFENEQKYPGVKIRARGKNLETGSFYGYETGIVGLRLFPNPDFDEAAAQRWDAEKYYTDKNYYYQKDLIRPYRVGMSCGFCHVGPNPLKPPADPENPKWENLSSNVGAQYFWIDRIFYWEADESNFVYQVFHTSRPGSLDTSLVSSDNINNPRTMNAIYQLLPRLTRAKVSGEEHLHPGTCVHDEQQPCGDEKNKQFNDFTQAPVFTQFFEPNSPKKTVWSPRVLKDGADSVGALGALNRVYINIGLFSEEWLLHFNALIGGKKVSPIAIADARKNSVYWQATEQYTMNMALFFLKTTAPHYLADADGGKQYVSKDASKLNQGKVVCAEGSPRYHCSKAPPFPADVKNPGTCPGAGYLGCWNSYWAWT